MEMAFRCADCGVETEDSRLLQKQRRSFRRTEYFVCPGCWMIRAERGHRRTIIIYVLIALGAGLWVMARPEPGFPVFLLNLALLYLFNFPAMILHEGGHALAASLVRWKTSQIVLGWFGKPIFKRSIAGVVWQLNSVPVGGMAFVYPRNENWFRTKASIVYLAGPLVNGLLALLCIDGWPFSGLDHEVQLRTMFGVANAISFAISIVPSKLVYGGTTLDTDGRLFLRAIFRAAKLKEDFFVGGAVMDALKLHGEGRSAEALKPIEESVQKYPGKAELLSTQAFLLLDLRQYEQARQIYAELLTNVTDPAYEACFLNNIAWINVEAGDLHRLEESLEYSERANSLFRAVPAYQGTRGSVLIIAGRAAEGIELLKASFDSKEPDDLPGKALNACMLARGEKMLGNEAESQRWLQVARELDPNCRLLPQ